MATEKRKVRIENTQMKPRISVIIPVYGVAQFVERCTRSLMNQTLRKDVEFIFVDDKTPDHSITIIEKVVSEFPAREGQVTILHHPENKGLPAARNTGLAAAKGEYIYHFDGDDYAEPELLERMLKMAEQTDADYVWADWLLTYEHSDRLMLQPSFATVADALKGVLFGRMKYNVWNKIVKHSLYTENNILFPAGFGMGEDMTMIRLLACAHKVAHCDYAGYHYVKTNSGAMTSNMSNRSYEDIRHNVDETVTFLKRKLSKDISLDIGAFCLNTKLPLLISADKSNYLRWTTLWPESNRYIESAGFSRRNRFLNKAADKGLWQLVKLHFIVYNFAYRLRFQ